MTDSQPLDTPVLDASTAVKPPQLPDKFWDEATGTIRLDALIKSYRALERRMTQDDVQEQEDPEVQRANLLASWGRPQNPCDYQIACSHGYIQNDPDVNARLHALGFTQDQAQAVYDLAAEKLVPTVLDIVADLQAEQEIARIVTHFGGPEKWRVVARQLLAFGRAHLPQDMLSHLARSYDGILILHDMMQARLGGAAAVQTPLGGTRAVDPVNLSNLRKMMADPAYWHDRDPKIMARVTEGFSRLYGEGG